MNLQPVYPAKVAGSEVGLICSNCKKWCLSGTAFADLDAQPGTFKCLPCVTAYSMTANKAAEMLLERDKKEQS